MSRRNDDDRGIGTRGGRNVAGRRPDSRHGQRRQDYGSWRRGDPIPGDVNNNGSPDMRDARNREKFLGETEEMRRERISNATGVRRRDDRDNEPRQRSRQDRSHRDEDRYEQQDSQIIDQDLAACADSLEDMNDDELIEVAQDLTILERQVFSEMRHRERSYDDNRDTGRRRDEPRQRRNEQRDDRDDNRRDRPMHSRRD